MFEHVNHSPGCVWICGPTRQAAEIEARLRCVCLNPRKRGGRCTACGYPLPDEPLLPEWPS